MDSQRSLTTSGPYHLGADALVACHDCDLLHRREPLPPRASARCRRCGAVLYQHKLASVDRTLHLTTAALILYALANAYPFMAFEIDGRVQTNSIITGVFELGAAGYWSLAALVFLSSILAPLLRILGLLYILLPVKLNRRPWSSELTQRIVASIHPWGMLDVYMLGVLVAIIKLSSLAVISFGVAFYSFVALMVVTTAATATFDPHVVWEHLEARRCRH